MRRSSGARRALLACALLAGALPAAVPSRAAGQRAESMPVPVALQVPLILRILTFDHNFDGRAPGELRIGVVVAPGGGGAARSDITDGFQALADRTVKGRRLRIVPLEWSSEAQMESALRAEQLHMLYVAPGNAAHVEAVVRLSRAHRIVTTTGVPGYVLQGIVVGLDAQQDKPQIVINLTSARACGVEFDASLLRISRILR